MTLRFFTLIAMATVLFTACSDKRISEYNKPAAYWYSKMVNAVATVSLEKADGYFSSLQSEHIGSPLLPEATMIMAQAHMQAHQYMLAEHFLDEYIRRFASSKQREFASYLKIKAKFMALANPRRDQTLINDALEEGKTFKANYSNSIYTPSVNTIMARFYFARANLNKTITSLYGRLDKPKAQAYYAEKEPETWINMDEVKPSNSPWFREIYEGDGTASWYASWLPEGTSVIAQDADGNTKE